MQANLKKNELHWLPKNVRCSRLMSKKKCLLLSCSQHLLSHYKTANHSFPRLLLNLSVVNFHGHKPSNKNDWKELTYQCFKHSQRTGDRMHRSNVAIAHRRECRKAQVYESCFGIKVILHSREVCRVEGSRLLQFN